MILAHGSFPGGRASATLLAATRGKRLVDIVTSDLQPQADLATRGGFNGTIGKTAAFLAADESIVVAYGTEMPAGQGYREWDRNSIVNGCRGLAYGVRTARQYGVTDLHIDGLTVESAYLAGYLAESANYDFESDGDLRRAKTAGSIGAAIPNVHVTASPEVSDEFEHGLIVGRARNLARNLMNTSSSVMTTTALMEAAKAVGTRHGMKVTVLDRKAMKTAGFDLTLSISQGSNPRKNPPYIVILEHLHDPKGPQAPRVVIVGKGVVHDTGGNNLKADCGTMHMDMGGAAEAIAEMDVVGQFNLPHNVAMIIFCVRNDIGPDMQITGTPVYSRLLKKTVRNGNTDAEGRLGLSECLAYAAQEWGANNGIHFGIDQATLTGLQRTFFLGMSTAWGTHGEMAWQAHRIGLEVGDRMNVAFLDYACMADLGKAGEHYDIGTIGLRKGPGGLGACGSTVAAEFVLQAVAAAGIPWLHIDMAGGSEVSADSGEFAQGGDAPNIITVIRILQDLSGFMERSGIAA